MSDGPRYQVGGCEVENHNDIGCGCPWCDLAAAKAECERLRALCAARPKCEDVVFQCARQLLPIAENEMLGTPLMNWVDKIDAAGRGEGK
jgi:hypothetical protein